MKVKPPKKAPISKSTVKQEIPELGLIKIIHTQSVRQSLNYNSAEASYGVEIYCRRNEDAIEKTVERAEKIVEEAMLVKFKEQYKLLASMTKGSR